MKLKFNVAVMSDVGMVRNNNEDNYYIPGLSPKPMNEPRFAGYTEFTADKAFLSVCDGMGGHSSGEVASHLVVMETEQQYQNFVNDTVKNKDDAKRLINEFILATNNKVYNMAESDSNLTTMGTTLTGLYFLNGKAYFVNVGDSRSYELTSKRFTQLSMDHADENTKNAITRYMGMSTEYGDMEADVAFVPSKVGYKKRYLLCSDGLTDMVTDEGIEGILTVNKDPKKAAELLIEEACRLGGRDNITVAVIDVCPANKLTKFFKNSFVKAVLSVLIAAAVGFGAWTLLKPEPIPAGLNLSALTQQIDNAKDYQEALKGAEDAISTQRDYITETKAYADGKTHGNVKISEKQTTLYDALLTLETAVNTYETELNKIKENAELTDNQKMEAIKNLNRKEYEDAYTVCETAKKELGDAWNEHASWSEKQESKEKAAEKSKSPNNNGGEKKPANNSSNGNTPSGEGNTQPSNDGKPGTVAPATQPNSSGTGGKPGTVAPATQPNSGGAGGKTEKNSNGTGGKPGTTTPATQPNSGGGASGKTEKNSNGTGVNP